MNWKKTTATALIFAGCIAASSGSFAANASLQSEVAGLKVLGCDMYSTKTGAITRVQVECDQQKVINNFPVLQRIGLMNPDITQTQLNLMPSMFASIFLQEITASLIHPLYRDTPAQESVWSGDLIVADTYGHMRRATVFTFRFNRPLDGKVNWDNFNDANLSKIAPGFALTPWGQHVFSDLN